MIFLDYSTVYSGIPIAKASLLCCILYNLNFIEVYDTSILIQNNEKKNLKLLQLCQCVFSE